MIPYYYFPKIFIGMNYGFTLLLNSVKVRILEPQFVGNEVGYFFKKNDEVAEKKLADVNKVLEEMLADGTIKEISKKWFYTDVTKTLN
jgi:ABC-type amino acid transport substrate-binding protein